MVAREKVLYLFVCVLKWSLLTSKPEEGWFGQPKYGFKIYFVVSALQ